jgi:hypothetical protein
MMKIFSKLFKRKTQISSSVNLSSTTARIGGDLNKLAMKIFKSYWSILLNQPGAYIIPAVWGIIEGGQLDPSQEEMNSIIAPVVEEMLESPPFRELQKEQAFTIRYLINGYIISKINYMTELLNNRIVKRAIGNGRDEDITDFWETIGHA